MLWTWPTKRFRTYRVRFAKWTLLLSWALGVDYHVKCWHGSFKINLAEGNQRQDFRCHGWDAESWVLSYQHFGTSQALVICFKLETYSLSLKKCCVSFKILSLWEFDCQGSKETYWTEDKACSQEEESEGRGCCTWGAWGSGRGWARCSACRSKTEKGKES